MAKDTFYFSHDYNVRNDPKIKKLLARHKWGGYGIFWAIIEDLYNNANALPLDYEGIAYDLRVPENIVESVINDFELFIIEDKTFGSLSVQKRLEERNAKSQKARISAFKRWNKSEGNANAMPSHSKGNAINKSKVIKVIKENNIESRKMNFASTLSSFTETYGRETIKAFYEYWSEPNKSGTKFRQEMEKTWDAKRRLEVWVSRDKNFSKKTTDGKQSKVTGYKESFNNVLEKRGINPNDFNEPAGNS